MPKYLFQATYTRDGAAGLLEDGGTGRRDAVEKLAASAGGVVEAMYFAFGSDDAVVIADLPDDETAAALALTVGSSGAVNIRTTVLLTPEQVDIATGKVIDYRAPGS